MGEEGQVDSYLRGLFVEAKWCDIADHGTVDCAYFCRCDDGSDYAVKTAAKIRTLPHQEWFCTRLGEMAGLASPPIRIVRVNGEESFGSRWESGVETGSPQNGWWAKAHAREIDFSLLAGPASRILAFDLFVHNVDRHLTNYLIRQQRNGHAMLAFDYSQAWLFNGFPLPAIPLNQQSGTVQAQRVLRALFGDYLDISEIGYVCQRLTEINSSQIEQIILEHPDKWLTNKEKYAILTWWNSSSRIDRINQVEEGIRDGTCL